MRGKSAAQNFFLRLPMCWYSHVYDALRHTVPIYHGWILWPTPNISHINITCFIQHTSTSHQAVIYGTQNIITSHMHMRCPIYQSPMRGAPILGTQMPH